MSVQFKDNIWYAVVYYRDEFNKKRYKWYPAEGQKAAERLEREIRSKLDKGELTITNKTTVKQYLNKWLELEIKPRRRPATVQNYQDRIDALCANLGEAQLDKLKPTTITEHLNKELARGLKPTSIQAQFAVLNQALKKAVLWQLLSRNPCDAVTPPQRNEPNNMVWSHEQVTRFLDFHRENSIYLVWLLGFLCGLRRGEILGLQWGNVDLKNKGAYVEYSLDRMDEEEAKRLLEQKEIKWYGCKSKTKADKKGNPIPPTVLALGPTKTKQSKGYASLPDIVIAVMEDIRKKQMAGIGNKKKNSKVKQAQLCDQNFVIRHRDGLPYEPDYITHALPKAIEAYNNAQTEEKNKLPALRVHDMRHTYVTILYELGLDTKAVSEAARHAKTSFTADYYVHLRKEVKQRPAEIINLTFKKGLG
ncbi:MAG: tyrosine-type recombinase/integrase [Sporomusaceae bacterium]|nr:tyrosine-type recombinase/integrase [Sporomusaceae bacterium]